MISSPGRFGSRFRIKESRVRSENSRIIDDKHRIVRSGIRSSTLLIGDCLRVGASALSHLHRTTNNQIVIWSCWPFPIVDVLNSSREVTAHGIWNFCQSLPERPFVQAD